LFFILVYGSFLLVRQSFVAFYAVVDLGLGDKAE